MDRNLLNKDWDRKPFVYLIGWSTVDVYYIGCRYAKGASEETLLRSYFTSSNYFKVGMLLYGTPDVMLVKSCDTGKEALFLESFLINMSDAANNLNTRYLNRGYWGTDGKVKTAYDREVGAKIAKANLGNKRHLGHKHSAETKARISKARTGRKLSEKHKRAISNGGKGKGCTSTPETLHLVYAMCGLDIVATAEALSMTPKALRQKFRRYNLNY